MAHVIVVGAGAIGSHLVPHLAHMPCVSAITVIDRDRYDQPNLQTQRIAPREVGKAKAAVQVRRLKHMNPAIAGTSIHRPVEYLPLGSLRADVILACLDSRRARLAVNQAAWRLGVPWINAGIDATGILARIQVFLPAPDAACLECAWDARDYELVEQTYPCQDAGGSTTASTNAPSALSALAASLQAIECQKLLSEDRDGLLEGSDLLLDARHHRHYVTAFRRNAACRMPDHAGWRITRLDGDPSTMTVDELVALGSTLQGAEGGLQIRVAGQRLAVALTCPDCGDRRQTCVLERAVRRSSSRCPRCEGELTATGFDLRDAVTADEIPEQDRARPTAELGLLASDVVTLATPVIEAHFELGGAA